MRGGKYHTISCARFDALRRPEVRAAIVRCWAKAADTNRRKYMAKVRAEIIDTCRDVLNGREPTREMLAVAARMRKRGYDSGWRARWGREKRNTAA